MSTFDIHIVHNTWYARRVMIADWFCVFVTCKKKIYALTIHMVKRYNKECINFWLISSNTIGRSFYKIINIMIVAVWLYVWLVKSRDCSKIVQIIYIQSKFEELSEETWCDYLNYGFLGKFFFLIFFVVRSSPQLLSLACWR